MPLVQPWWSVIFALLALLCKEQGVTVLGLCIPYDIYYTCRCVVYQEIKSYKRHLILHNVVCETSYTVSNTNCYLCIILEELIC